MSEDLQPEESAEPKRGGCVMLWLAFMLAAYVLAAAQTLIFRTQIMEAMPSLTEGRLKLIFFLYVVGVPLIVAMLRGRRWGVYGFALVSLVQAGHFMMVYGDLQSAVRPLIGLGLLLVVLNVGGENKAWARLK